VPQIIEQQRFEQCAFASDTGLNVHRRQGQRRWALVLFVHGLLGRGYETWGAFPKYIFDDSPHNCDVAIFDYINGARRRLWRRDPTVLETAEELVGELREVIQDYRYIFLVGHSLGGTVAELAAMNWIEAQPRGAQHRITPLAALLTFATPRAGSLRVPRLLAFNSDLRFLRPHSPISRMLDRFSSDHLETRLDSQPSSDRTFLPRFCLVANSDYWADKFSVTFGVTTEQIRVVKGYHKTIVKPERADAEPVRWLNDRIGLVLAARRKLQLSRALDPGSPESPIIVTRFLGDFDEPYWEYAYHMACRNIEMDIGIPVHDSRDLPEPLPTSIAVRIIAASSAESGNTVQRDKLTADLAAQQVNGRYTLAISPNGNGHEAAVTVIKGWLGQEQPDLPRWVNGSENIEALHQLVIKWLLTLAARFSRRYRSEDDRLEAETLKLDLPRNVRETDTTLPRDFGGDDT
jgi:pimeloyl-ACP methyl ester carboxylesterase